MTKDLAIEYLKNEIRRVNADILAVDKRVSELKNQIHEQQRGYRDKTEALHALRSTLFLLDKGRPYNGLEALPAVD